MRKLWMVALTFLLAILLLAACGDKDNAKKEDTENGAQEMELPEPNLDDIPDVVAEVNGEEIKKADFEGVYQQQFQQQSMQAQMSGQDIDIDEDKLKKQTAEGLVAQELLAQEANNRFSKVPKEDTDKLMDELVEQNGMDSKDQMIEEFKKQGMEEKELMALVEDQVKIEKFIEEEAGDFEPTEDELKEAYEMMKSQQEEAETEEELPDFDDIKTDIAAQLKQQKQAEETQSIVDSLRKKADVTIHV